MKTRTVVILRDHQGYTERVKALQSVNPAVYPVSSVETKHPHTRKFSIPDEWLPADESIPRGKRQWFKADMMGIAAVVDLRIKADFYWFIESDVAASPERWKALFEDHHDNRADVLSNTVRSRPNGRAAFWSHPGTPDWASRAFMTACYRLSARAVEECIRCAEETRETFCEVSTASILHRAGMTFSHVNERQLHWNDQTFKGVDRCIVNPKLICHPCKYNSALP